MRCSTGCVPGVANSFRKGCAPLKGCICRRAGSLGLGLLPACRSSLAGFRRWHRRAWLRRRRGRCHPLPRRGFPRSPARFQGSTCLGDARLQGRQRRGLRILAKGRLRPRAPRLRPLRRGIPRHCALRSRRRPHLRCRPSWPEGARTGGMRGSIACLPGGCEWRRDRFGVPRRRGEGPFRLGGTGLRLSPPRPCPCSATASFRPREGPPRCAQACRGMGKAPYGAGAPGRSALRPRSLPWLLLALTASPFALWRTIMANAAGIGQLARLEGAPARGVERAQWRPCGRRVPAMWYSLACLVARPVLTVVAGGGQFI